MASLYDLAMQYLNQSLPETFKYDRTNQPGTLPPVTLPPQDPNAPTARILPMPGGGGDGFSVYNSDPNRTRNESNYSPYDYRQAFGKTDYQDFNPSSTYAAKQMEMNPEYYEGKQLTGLPGAAQNYLKNSFLGKGLSALGDKLPVNRRAILENELLGSGMQLNDIGQFVSDGGDINKADGSNIMAGYNAAKVTQETFDKRRATIEKNMKDPKQKAAKLAALDAAETSFFGAKTKADMVFDDKSLAKDPTYKSLADKIATGNTINSEKENDEDGEASYYDPLNQIDSMPSFTGLNAPSTFTLTAPQYGTSFGQGYGSGYGPGDGTGSGGSYDNSAITYGSGDGTGSSGSYDEAGVGDPYSDDNFMVGDNSQASPSGNIFDGGSTYDEAGVDTYQGGTTQRPGSGGGSGGDSSPSGGGGTHCCTAANERGDMTLLEVKKLRVWHRKQSKIWQKGYDVWGRVMADHLVSKYKWSSDRVRDFYNHKIYGKRTIGSTFADLCIYPMSMVIGCILTVMPPILGYQENKKNG